MKLGITKDKVRATIVLAWPIAAGQLGSVLMGTVDTVMVGRLGAFELAAMAMANTLWFVNLVFAIGVIGATSPLISSALGSNQASKIQGFVTHGIRIALILSVTTVGSFLVSRPVFRFFGQDPSLVESGFSYLLYLSLGVPAYYCFYSLRMYSDSTSKTRPAMLVILAGLLANVFLNDVLIYGRYGLSAMGVKGAGLATSIVYWLMFLIMLTFVSFSARYKNSRIIQPRLSWSFETTKTILRLGLPVGLANLFEVSFFMFCALLVGTIGTVDLAAHQIAINLASLTFMISNGISHATSIQIARAHGRSDLTNIREQALIGYGLVLACMSLITVAFVLTPNLFISLYTKDPSIARIAAPLLVIAGVFQIWDGVQVLGISACKGMQDTKLPMFSTIIAFIAIGMPGSFLLSQTTLSTQGVWWGMVIGLFIASILHALRLRWLLKKS